MSKHIDSEHGTTLSYFIGFVLSLIFSFIPYYMVTEEIVTGNTLYFTILCFAFVQMIIQITFFLHIGRGPKPNWNLFFFGATFVVILMVVGGSVFIIDNLHYNMSPEEKLAKIANDEGIYEVEGNKTGACKEILDNHQIIIEDETVYPIQTYAKQCDTLTFINKDDEVRNITFGAHPEHGYYAGEDEIIVKKGRNETITLSETGNHLFHDHEKPEINGFFSVEP
jgi:cytochrome o ubiquinol oxidase operon protein cyoD